MPQIKLWSTSLQSRFVGLWYFFFLLLHPFFAWFWKSLLFWKTFQKKELESRMKHSHSLELIQTCTRSDWQSRDITTAKWPPLSWSLPIPEGTGAHRTEASSTAVWITHYPRADQSASTTTAARAKQSSEQRFILKGAPYLAQPINSTHGF